ncbi:hypothetical protein HG537_0B01800 [Torulaspora globosa]|uniref:Serine/threonine-protein kinase MEC1 n=1 Tax=Torulaspora globosa TaxID=48254 RepID=A0A7H9HR68_9SACH|nr:hypothetical protein HG537_0B01800 [Torulaspora sp. CBS 2947]
MESHIKYLDELKEAINGSRIPLSGSGTDEFSSGSSTRVEEDEGREVPVKILTTMIRNLKNPQKNDMMKNNAVFAKSIQVMDALIRSRPGLLVQRNGNVDLGTLISDLVDISVINYEQTHRMWFIRRKLGCWCKIFAQLYGGVHKMVISNVILDLLARFEESLAQIFETGRDPEAVVLDLKSLYVICYWLCGPPETFGYSLAMLNSWLGVTKWDSQFQKIIRFVFYVFSSLKLSRSYADVSTIHAKFLSLNVEHFINKLPLYSSRRQLYSTDHLKFTLRILKQFLRERFGCLRDDAIVAKCLLRVYLFCITVEDTAVNDLFAEFDDDFSLTNWLDGNEGARNKLDILAFDPLTSKALLLIHLDRRRRSVSQDNLEFDQETKIWYCKPEGRDVLKTVLIPSEPPSQQLDALCLSILKRFRSSGNELNPNSEMARIGKQAASLYHSRPDQAVTMLTRLSKEKGSSKDINAFFGVSRVLGRLACLESQRKEAKYDLRAFDACNICDSIRSGTLYHFVDPDRPTAQKSASFRLLDTYILSSTKLEEFPEPLLADILLALQRIFTHHQPPKLSLDVSDSAYNNRPFAFVQRCFSSPSRYLRILAARLIPLWNITNLYNSEDQHTAVLIRFLQENDFPYAIETSAMSWAQLALTATGEVFDTLLLKLIDIFNSTNYALHIMMAFQIKNTAGTLRKTSYQLLSPILPILLRRIGKNLLERRVSFQRLIWLLGYSAKTILDIYQRYIIPHAITQYKSDVFSEIARIMCDDDSAQIGEAKKALLEKNSRQIFAVALVKHGLLSLDTMESLFSNRVPSFDKRYVVAYLPDYKTLAEILKLYKNDADDESQTSDNETMVLVSLRYLVTNFEKDKRHGSKYKNISDWTHEREARFQERLQEHILGIFQVFSSDVHDAEGRTTYYEKLRVVNGIAFLIRRACKKSIIASLAQVSICLQTALEIEEVSFSALKCWRLLIFNLNDEELAAIIDGFLCYILQKWSQFNIKLGLLISEILTFLVKERKELLLRIKPYLTLALIEKSEIDILSRDGNFARAAGHVISSTDWITVFAHNLQSTNKYVINQSLDDLEVYMKRKETKRSADFFQRNEQISDISLLLGSLLDTSHRFKSDALICTKCAKCISIIGAVDATRQKALRKTAAIREVYDLNDEAQTRNFLIWVMNDLLVPAFWQSENPNKQLFVALVMQESLKYCGLNSASWDINRKDLYPNESKLWDKFDSVAKTTLYPLLSSLYLAQSWKEYEPLSYPSFTFKEGYIIWIKSFCLDLLKTGTEENHPLHVFSSLIREDDGSLSNFLLPYISMDIIINADSSSSKATLMRSMIEEFKSIFECDLDGLNHLQIDSLRMCYQAIFRIFEYCKKWMTQFKQDYYHTKGSYIIREKELNDMLKRIDEFLGSFSPALLAQRSLETDSFERSALYLEQSFRQESAKGLGDVEHKNLILPLQRTYEEIGDLDSLDGLLKMFSKGNLKSKIEELQYSESWKLAQDCYNTLGSFADWSFATTKMLTSMHDHQLYSELLLRLEFLAPRICQLDAESTQWYRMGIEAANLEGNPRSLDSWLERVECLQEVKDPELLFQYNMARALGNVRAGNGIKVNQYLNKCLKIMGTHLMASTVATTLLKKQTLLVKLHSLYDIILLSSSTDSAQFQSNAETLDFRMTRIGPNFESNHYLLSVRKSYELLAKKPYTEKDIQGIFFEISKLCRDNGRLDIASDSLMRCLSFNHPQAELEFAEILLKQGENDRAIKLVKEINEKYKNDPVMKPRDKAAVLLKYTEWLDLTNNSASEQIIEQYQNIFQLDPKWDKPYYSIGLYYSRLLERKKAEGYITNGKLEYMSISYFLLAFEKNTVKIRETLPKVVTFWLDIAAESVKEKSASRREPLKQATEDICRHVEESLRKSPAFIWYPVLTQLLSRLLHVHQPTEELISQILLNLTSEYPSHILWYISTLLNSTSTARANRGRYIIDSYRKTSDCVQEMITNTIDLTQAFTKVCLKEVKNAVSRSGRSLEKDFRFDMSMAPSKLAVPVQINLDMISPLSSQSNQKYTPFGEVITIAKFGTTYKVFSSLKKPKKLNVIGSDGKVYGIMCKKEDVRQDNQYMQFATTMDFLLKKDVESMKRNLGITTYSVLPLREDCGLLEIVPNVVTLRSIFVTKYESLKVKYSLKNLYEKWQNSPDSSKLSFYRQQLETFPPILYQWFLETFPDPIVWFNARNTYARSYAVMAMVGHILGLGDRHCENILLDVESGKILHVDFDCLFEKGRRLPVPEIVPFRLTQNLYDALGIIGTEGTFKRSSEVTVSLMRDNEVSLVNVIETIMYDRNMDSTIQKALKILRNKIRGIDARDGLVLSVPGQVETLIQESTSEENLSKMYIGWLAFW